MSNEISFGINKKIPIFFRNSIFTYIVKSSRRRSSRNIWKNGGQCLLLLIRFMYISNQRTVRYPYCIIYIGSWPVVNLQFRSLDQIISSNNYRPNLPCPWPVKTARTTIFNILFCLNVLHIVRYQSISSYFCSTRKTENVFQLIQHKKKKKIPKSQSHII